MGVCNWEDFPVIHFLPIGQLLSSKGLRKAPVRLHILNFFKQTYRYIDIDSSSAVFELVCFPFIFALQTKSKNIFHRLVPLTLSDLRDRYSGCTLL